MIRRRQRPPMPFVLDAVPTVAPASDPAGAVGTAGADRPTRRREGTSVAAAVAGAVLALLAVAPPAVAHDELTGTTPADGASVEVPPAAVELTFSEPPLGLGSQVQVTGPDGEVVNAGDLQITDTVVSQPLASDLPAGDYAIAWRVTSADGHPISGELAFTAVAGTAGASEPATPEPTSSGEAPPASEPEETTGAPEPTSPDTAVATPDDGVAVQDPDNGATPWLVGAAIVLVVGGALWWVRRQRPGSGPAQG